MAQTFVIKQEPEDSMECCETFPMVDHFSFSSNETLAIEPMVSKSPKLENNIPALWELEKSKIEAEYPDGVPPKSTLAAFDESTKQEVISSFIPKPRQLPRDVMERAEEMKAQERQKHEDFVEMMLNQYPVDKTYNPNKARKYSEEQEDDDTSRERSEARKANNNKSMVSRHKKKIEREVNAYTVIHLRERILEYQTRMNFMKEMLLQTKMDEQFDDLSSFEEMDSEMESLSSISSG